MDNLEIQDHSHDKKYFTIVPNYILVHGCLYDREVYVQIKRIAGEHTGGTCWASQATLAKRCGISKNRLKKSLDFLVEHKLIRFMGERQVGTAGGIQSVNEYAIVDIWKRNIDYFEGMSPHDTPCVKGGSRKPQRGVTKVPKGGSSGENKEEPVKEEPYKEERHFSYLENLSNETKKEFSRIYNCSPSQVEAKAESVVLYCSSKGKNYKNYKSALQSWLLRDYGKRKLDFMNASGRNIKPY